MLRISRSCARRHARLSDRIHYSSPLTQGARSPGVPGSLRPTVPTLSPPLPRPKGMASIPGGEFSMGARGLLQMDMVGVKDHYGFPAYPGLCGSLLHGQNRRNQRAVYRLVKATGYVTIAENASRRGLSGAPPEICTRAEWCLLPAWSVDLNGDSRWWSWSKANSRLLTGPRSSIRGRESSAPSGRLPDAEAYAELVQQLPAEAEREFATRGGLGRRDILGSEFKPNGKFMANTYLGLSRRR